MKATTIKKAGIISLAVLSLILLYQNNGMRDELRQYRAAEIYLAEEERTAEDCLAYARTLGRADDTLSDMLWLVAAQKGNADAQSYLGRELDTYPPYRPNRYSSIKDRESKSEKWLLAAARQGSPKHMETLARFYDYSRPDDKTARRQMQLSAFHWYREAALRGHAYCMYQVASMYRLGEGVEKDLALAEQWFNKAEAAGDQSAPGGLWLVYMETGRKNIADAMLKKGLEEGLPWAVHIKKAQEFEDERQRWLQERENRE